MGVFAALKRFEWTPVKVLLVVDGRLQKPAGAEKQAILLATALSRRGHEVALLGPRFDASEPLCDSIDGVPVYKIAYPRVRIVGAIILMLKFMYLLLGRFGSYDAVHVHMAKNLAAAAGFLKPIAGWTLTVKISGAWEFEGGILDPALRDRPVMRLRNRLIRRADAIQTISEYTRGRLLEAGYSPAQIRMIPNAVELPDLEHPAAVATKGKGHHIGCTVAFVGRLVPVKGLDVLLSAWASMPRDLEARLLVIGDGPERGALEQLANRLSVQESVSFVGYSSDVSSYLRSAEIYVQPSRQEGMPNSVLQAMACGLPIVATAISGNMDLVIPSENGLLVPREDAPALRDALCELIANPGRRRQMGEASRARAARSFELQRVLDSLERAYRGGVSQ